MSAPVKLAPLRRRDTPVGLREAAADLKPWAFELHPGLGTRPCARMHAPEAAMPARRHLRVFSQDPGLGRADGAVFTASVPYEPLEPGPSGAVLVVDDLDETTGERQTPLNLEQPALLMERGISPSSTNRQYMQQMVYAVGMETYERFVRALGRDPGFGPLDGPGGKDGRLRIQPCAFLEANAYYDREAGALKFGYDLAKHFAQGRSQPGGRICTSLSRDIVVHEMSHALLDGLRPNFLRPTHRDVDALHEGFADLVAIFLRFSQSELVERAIDRSQGKVEDDLLASVGRQFGFDLIDGRSPLRTALTNVPRDQPIPDSRLYTKQDEAHDLGAVLVSAVFDAFSQIFERRARRVKLVSALYQGRLSTQSVELLAQEAGKIAKRFLNIIIRAIDYCPPLHCSFGEYLRAIITADHELVGDDPAGYREALVSSFRRFGVTVPDVSDLSEESLLWGPPEVGAIVIDGLRFENLGLSFANGMCDWPDDDGRALRKAADAFGRAVCTPLRARDFGLAKPEGPIEKPRVVSLRTLRRVSPDGDVHFDLVAEIVQKRAVREGFFLGGSTVIVSSEGRVRYSIAKNIGSVKRLREQRRWLKTQPPEVRDGAWDRHSIVAARLQRRLHLESR